MDRLVEKYNKVYSPKGTIDKNVNAAMMCGDICNEYCEDCDLCPIQKVFNRLAEYEATGLTPDEIICLKSDTVFSRYGL